MKTPNADPTIITHPWLWEQKSYQLQDYNHGLLESRMENSHSTVDQPKIDALISRKMDEIDYFFVQMKDNKLSIDIE